MSKEQESTISQLKNDLSLLREERENETENFSSQVIYSPIFSILIVLIK